MPRKVFYSFHYDADNWRAAKVRNIGAVEGNQPTQDNDWEAIKRGGDTAIQRWIDGQLAGRSCAVVLIGSGTAGRKWINYEINEAWRRRLGVLGIYIHNLTDRHGLQSSRGANPFAHWSLGGSELGNIVPVYDPAGWTSSDVYNHIARDIGAWIEHAIQLRQQYR